MNRITYERSSFNKQLFLILTWIYFLMRFIIIIQVKIYRTPHYHENIYFGLTFFMYFSIMASILFLLLGHAFFYVTYDDEIITYHHLLGKKTNSVEIGAIQTVVFQKRKVLFYTEDPDSYKTSKPAFAIPLFRFGRTNPIEMNQLFLFLKKKENITIYKNFVILPGFEKWRRIFSILYGIGSVVVFMNWATPIKVIIVLFQNHR